MKDQSEDTTETSRKTPTKGGNHWVTMDPRVEMTFLASSTLPGENLNTGEIEACWGNWSFSKVSFLVWT